MNKALLLAAHANCHPKTAERALAGGPSVIRTNFLRERITAAMQELGFSADSNSDPPHRAA